MKRKKNVNVRDAYIHNFDYFQPELRPLSCIDVYSCTRSYLSLLLSCEIVCLTIPHAPVT